MELNLSSNSAKIFLFFIILLVPFSLSAATLSLSPNFDTKTTGTIFPVAIILDTQGVPVDGVDIRYLNYNPTLLEAQDDDPASAGIQITPGVLMSQTWINSVDAGVGQIAFSQLIGTGGSQYSGSGTFATIRFKALGTSGTASVTLDYTQGSTIDTNVVANGGDILTSVVQGSYSLVPVTPGQTPIPTVTPVPPSTGGGGGGNSSGGGGGGGGYIPPAPAPTPITITNPAPTSSLTNVVLRNLTQEKSNGAPISEGSAVTDSSIIFKGLLFDANNKRVKLEIELRRTSEDFMGLPTISSVYYNSGEIAKIERGGLTPGSYRFRARASNLDLEKSDWLEFGSPSIRDFIITTATPAGVQKKFTYTFTRTLKVGSRGADVKVLQETLNQFGFSLGIASGTFGQKTAAIVKAFQVKYGVTPTSGIFGPKTRAKLIEVYEGGEASRTMSARTLRRGSRGEDVKKLQEMLNKLGFSIGTPTGFFGQKTLAAVKAFQKQYGLSMDGLAGPKTLEKIKILVK